MSAASLDGPPAPPPDPFGKLPLPMTKRKVSVPAWRHWTIEDAMLSAHWPACVHAAVARMQRGQAWARILLKLPAQEQDPMRRSSLTDERQQKETEVSAIATTILLHTCVHASLFDASSWPKTEQILTSVTKSAALRRHGAGAGSPPLLGDIAPLARRSRRSVLEAILEP